LEATKEHRNILAPYLDGPLKKEFLEICTLSDSYAEKLLELRTTGEGIDAAIERLEVSRYKLFLQVLKDEGLAWCAECGKLIAKPQPDEMQYLFLRQLPEEGDGFYASKLPTALQIVCPKCYQKAFDSSGIRFTAHRVKKEGDDFYYMFGEWTSVPAETHMALKPFLSDEWAEAFEIPPDIRFDTFHKKMVIGREEVDLQTFGPISSR